MAGETCEVERMRKTKTRAGFSKLKITWLMLALAGMLAVGSYGWHVYSLFRDWQMNMPQPQFEKLTNDLRLYHTRTGQFPAVFTEINELLWHTKPAPDYGSDGRQARTKNYYYFYTRVNEQTCAIWALPTGPRRQYASSFFIVLTPEWLRSWKGKAIEDDVINRLPAIPKPDQLAALMMQEMPSRVFNQQNEKGSSR
ncbi:MAG TPA: hypothetical protein PLQ88_30250 [Blastocatellia bacterium]|nr:hypothetical protein [Blastocatellia bacterium]